MYSLWANISILKPYHFILLLTFKDRQDGSVEHLHDS